MKIPPGTPRSRSLTRFTMRVGLPHLGQSVLFEVSITFLRSAVFAILAIHSLLGSLLHNSVSDFALRRILMEFYNNYRLGISFEDVPIFSCPGDSTVSHRLLS